MVTLIYSDGEGWSVVEQFSSEKEADSCVKELMPEKGYDCGFNPGPITILEDHTIKKYSGFRYC